MFTPEAADTISRLSAFALFVFLVGVIAIGLWRRWWVPGWLYEQERAARQVAETQAVRNAEALEASNVSMASQRRLQLAIRRELGEVRRDLHVALSARRDHA